MRYLIFGAFFVVLLMKVTTSRYASVRRRAKMNGAGKRTIMPFKTQTKEKQVQGVSQKQELKPTKSNPLKTNSTTASGQKSAESLKKLAVEKLGPTKESPAIKKKGQKLRATFHMKTFASKGWSWLDTKDERPTSGESDPTNSTDISHAEAPDSSSSPTMTTDKTKTDKNTDMCVEGICNSKPTQVRPCKTKADIGIVVDASGSLRRFYQKELQFVKDLADTFGIDVNGSRASVVTFSNVAQMNIKFSDHTDANSFKNAVSKLPYTGHTTRIDRALVVARDEMFLESNGARESVPKLLIVITDGSQTRELGAVRPAEIAEQIRRKYGVTIFSVGIGSSVKQNELEQIAASESRVFVTENFVSLLSKEFISKLTEGVCLTAEESIVGTTPSTTTETATTATSISSKATTATTMSPTTATTTIITPYQTETSTTATTTEPQTETDSTTKQATPQTQTNNKPTGMWKETTFEPEIETGITEEKVVTAPVATQKTDYGSGEVPEMTKAWTIIPTDNAKTAITDYEAQEIVEPETGIETTERPCITNKGTIVYIKVKNLNVCKMNAMGPWVEPCSTSQSAKCHNTPEDWSIRSHRDQGIKRSGSETLNPWSSWRKSDESERNDKKMGEYFRRKYDPTYRVTSDKSGSYDEQYKLKYGQPREYQQQYLQKYAQPYRQKYDNQYRSKYERPYRRKYEQYYRKYYDDSDSELDEKMCDKVFVKSSYIKDYVDECVKSFTTGWRYKQKYCRKMAKRSRKVHHAACRKIMTESNKTYEKLDGLPHLGTAEWNNPFPWDKQI